MVSVLSFTPLPGCFSPFPRGTLRYRSTQVFSLGEWSPLFPTGYLVPRGTRVHQAPPRPAVDDGALTRSGRSFQILCLAVQWTARTRQGPPLMAHNPPPATPAGLTREGFGLLPVRSPLLGESFLFLGVLRCFSSPTYLHPVYVFNRGYQAFNVDLMSCLIRASTAHCLPAAHRRFSQLAAPFIGLCRLGILHGPSST